MLNKLTFNELMKLPDEIFFLQKKINKVQSRINLSKQKKV